MLRRQDIDPRHPDFKIDPKLFAQVNPDVQKRIEVFSGLGSSSQPQLLNVGNPITSVLDIGREQYEVISLYERGPTGAVGGHTTTWNSPDLLERLRSAKAIEYVNAGFTWDPGGAVAVDWFAWFDIKFGGLDLNVPFMFKPLAPGFNSPEVKITDNANGLKPKWKGWEFYDESATATRENGTIHGIQMEWVRAAGTVTFDISDVVLTLGLYY